MQNRLAAKVKAVNAANDYAGQLYDTLKPILRPFIGQQIIRSQGGLFAKIKSVLPKFPCEVSLSVYTQISDYSLCWVVKTCVDDNGIANYHETVVYVGKLLNGVLTDIYDRAWYRTNYTAAEIVKNRQLYVEAKKAADEAFTRLYPFGEHDL